MRTLVVILSILAISALLCAQQVRTANDGSGDNPAVRGIAGPSLGILASETVGVRVVRGVPGAATMGPALGVPGLARWAVSPDRDFLIGVTAASGRLVLARNLSRVPEVSALARWGLRDATVALSPKGRAAAVYDPGLGRIAVFVGLPEHPVLEWSKEWSAADGGLETLAVRDDAERVLFAAAGSLRETSRDGRIEHVAALSGRAGIGYLPDSGEIVFTDAGSKTLSWVRNGSVAPVVTEQDGLTAPVAVATAGDRREVFVANADPPAVIAVDLDSGAVSRTALKQSPTMLCRLAGRAVFQLNEAGGGAVRLLSINQGQARHAFIPAASDPAGEGGAE